MVPIDDLPALSSVVLVDAADDCEGKYVVVSAVSSVTGERIDVGVLLPEVEVDDSFDAFAWLPFLTALKISIGKSATPMVKLANVPIKAEAPPDIGSQGPSSVSYSFGRYLHKISRNSKHVRLLTALDQRNQEAPRLPKQLQQERLVWSEYVLVSILQLC